MTLHEEIQHIGAAFRRDVQGQENWKVVDPARVAAGYMGTTYHRTEAEAKARALAFPGSVVSAV